MTTLRIPVIALALAGVAFLQRPEARTAASSAGATESRIRAGDASLYVRSIGAGRPLIVLHGGPDFDMGYLLPEMDRLKDAFRLVYYDQRGRGKSARGVKPEDVTLASEVADLDRVRRQARLESTALLGHSWGALLALEYARRHPERVSRLILMNPAPVSTADLDAFRRAYAWQLGADMDRQRAIVESPAYKAGDPETVYARYRLHFEHALARPADFEQLMAKMRAGFVSQGRDGILKARAVEDRLMQDTWRADGYDLLPALRTLRIPTLVIAGDHDFIPLDIPTHIAEGMPDAQLVTLKDCGHFAYMECAADVHAVVSGFFGRAPARR